MVRGDGTETERKLVISNRQFQLGTLHAEVMARLKTPSYSLEDKQHVVVSTSEFQPWVGVLDVAHAKCVWVVCIDPIVDEKLIRSGSSDREIIGFGTGVGPTGVQFHHFYGTVLSIGHNRQNKRSAYTPNRPL